MYNELERELVRCSDIDIGIEQDHGAFVMFGVFEGEGWGQGLGYCINDEFIKRFIKVFNVDRLQKVNGRHCFITHNHDKITKIDPLFRKDGEAFDIEEWVNECKAKEA